MLYERWRQITVERRDELALRDGASGRRWTFGELFAAAMERRPPARRVAEALTRRIGVRRSNASWPSHRVTRRDSFWRCLPPGVKARSSARWNTADRRRRFQRHHRRVFI